MRSILLVSFLGFCSNFLLGQFIYESSDFISIGDEIIYSNALSLDPAVDFTLAGDGVLWDFSNLTNLNTDTVSYFDPNDSGYQFFYCFTNAFIFNCGEKYNELTNLAELSIDSFVVGDFRTANITRHYHLSEGEFAETMLGVTAEIEGVSVPIAIDFEQRDVVLKFPLELGIVDSSESRFVFDLSPTGLDLRFARNRKRVNLVEGYGSLITPTGTYDEVLKMKTMIYNQDTTSFDTLSVPINSVEVEYKWYAKGIAGHVLKANGTVIAGNEVIAQVQYKGVENTASTSSLEYNDIEIYPNPFGEFLQVRSSQIDFSSYELVNQLGQRVSHAIVSSGQFEITQLLNPGTYFLIIRDEKGSTWVRKVLRL